MNNEVQTAQLLKDFEDRMKKPAWHGLLSLVAQEKFAKFKAYQRAGFDTKQALELVIREGQ